METPFLFADNPLQYAASNCHLVDMPCTIGDEGQLMRELRNALDLPEYFGENWNALDECVNDFHWIPQHRIVLWHATLPPLPRIALETYLYVFASAVRDWHRRDKHELLVVFHPEVRSRIVDLCKNYDRRNATNIEPDRE